MDDHPGLAAELTRVSHPTRWTVAIFDWFSDEYTVMGRARSKAEGERMKARLVEERRDLKPEDLVVLPPGR